MERDPWMFAVHEDFDMLLGKLGPVVIAGGAVRDWMMGRLPRDVDVFILGGPSNEDVERAAAGLPKLALPPLKPYGNSLVIKTSWGGFDVDIVSRPEKDVEELLDGFDWNVSLFAYSGRDQVRSRMDPGDIKPGGELVLQSLEGKYPESVLRRGFRFVERYGMRIPDATMIDLTAAVSGDRMKRMLGQ